MVAVDHHQDDPMIVNLGQSQSTPRIRGRHNRKASNSPGADHDSCANGKQMDYKGSVMKRKPLSWAGATICRCVLMAFLACAIVVALHVGAIAGYRHARAAKHRQNAKKDEIETALEALKEQLPPMKQELMTSVQDGIGKVFADTKTPTHNDDAPSETSSEKEASNEVSDTSSQDKPSAKDTPATEDDSDEESKVSGSSNSGPSEVTFLFLMGTEGTGHDTFASLFHASPMKVRLKQWGIYPTLMNDLTTALYNNVTQEEGLFSAPCSPQAVDGSKVFQNVVQTLSDVERIALESSGGGHSITIPINAVEVNPGQVNPMTYPTPNSECPYHQFPHLGLFYKACEAAKVQCRHVLSYRDAWNVVRSTEVQLGPLRIRMKLLANMLNIVAGQLKEHPDNLLGCWSYSNLEPPVELGRTLGWSSTSRFKTVYTQLVPFDEKAIKWDSQKKEIVPETLQMFMQAAVAATDRLERICERIVSLDEEEDDDHETRAHELIAAGVSSSQKNDDCSNLSSSGLKFIFLMGGEETGHAIFSSVYQKSPSKDKLVKAKLFPEFVEQISTRISHQKQEWKTLFPAQCFPGNDSRVDGPSIKSQVIKALNIIKENKSFGEGDSRLAVPLNAVETTEQSFPKIGPMSYPNQDGPCRPLRFPDLALLYDACKDAGVQCEHILSYRDPWEVIKSSKSEDTMTSRLQLMTAMLYEMEGQLLDSPDQVAACWNHNLRNEVTGAAAGPEEIGRLLGWDADAKFQKVYKDSFGMTRPPIVKDTDKNDIVPPQLQLYMEAALSAGQRIGETCQYLLSRRQDREEKCAGK